MFKSARWRSDKNKIKAVFKLQFNATQISNFKGDSLVISVIPADVGKPTAKLEKSIVKDGCCNWEKPVYETVKFARDSKTGKIHERLYKFVVSTGSTKGSLVGEASIDFANYAASTKLSSDSLPLKNANSEAVLHVSIERMLDSIDQRESEENETPKHGSEDRTLRSQLSNGDTNSTEDMSLNKALPQITELNADSRGSSGSIATVSSLEWLAGSAPEVSTDDSSNSPREILLREMAQEGPDMAVEKLKAELAGLARQANMSELELQTLRKQIVKETKRGQDLLRELVSVKEERDAYKDECEKLNSLKKREKTEIEGGDPLVLLEELKEEIKHEKELNTNLRIQLEKTQESNAELILAVRDLDEMLEKKNRENLNLSSGTDLKCETDDEDQRALEEIVKEHSDDKESYLLEQKIMDLHSEVEICRRDRDELEMQMEQLALDYEILKQENHDISYKLEQSQVQEQLKIQYECSTSFATVNELENQIESLEDELKKQSKEFLDSRVTIKGLETQIMSLEDALKKKSDEFSYSLVTIKELENHIESYEDELKKNSEEISESRVTIKELENQVERYEDELKKQSKEFSDSLLTIKELENQIERYEDELKKQSKEFSDSLLTIKELENQIESYEDESKKKSKQFSDSLLSVKELENQIESNEDELKKQSQQFSDSLLTIKELENQIKSYEDELKKKSKEFSDSLVTIKELEDNVKDLEEELENQAQGFEADLEALTCAKIEAEKKAIKAEESLRKTRRQNADTAERIQEEFRKLSVQMASTFVANEKVALKAVSEARELRLEKIGLEELLNKAKEDLRSVNSQLDLKVNQIEESEMIIRDLKLEIGTHKAHFDDLDELANLKEKIKSLEGEIMEKETALENSTNSYLKKEIDRHSEFSKKRDVDDDGVSKEMGLLKERNKSMEVELKEMQERYSEISLKFAEVEGERQQLVMTLRNLKNSKKI